MSFLALSTPLLKASEEFTKSLCFNTSISPFKPGDFRKISLNTSSLLTGIIIDIFSIYSFYLKLCQRKVHQIHMIYCKCLSKIRLKVPAKFLKMPLLCFIRFLYTLKLIHFGYFINQQRSASNRAPIITLFSF